MNIYIIWLSAVCTKNEVDWPVIWNSFGVNSSVTLILRFLDVTSFSCNFLSILPREPIWPESLWLIKNYLSVSNFIKFKALANAI